MTRPPSTEEPRCERIEGIDDGRLTEPFAQPRPVCVRKAHLFGYPNRGPMSDTIREQPACCAGMHDCPNSKHGRILLIAAARR